MSNLLTEFSPWFIFLCILVGLGYAFLLYQKEAPWGKTTNWALFSVRALIVTVICFLLLGPYFKHVKNYFEKPTVVFAIDNSQSIPLVVDSSEINSVMQKLNSVANKLRENNYDVDIKLLSADQGRDNTDPNDFQNISFGFPQTDLSHLLRSIQSEYENKNLAEVVLLTDGIYNQGVSPDFIPYNMTISAIGIGDTMPQTDINLKSVYSNKIAYLGNKFPIVAELINTGFKGKATSVLLKHKGKEIERKLVDFKADNGVQTVDFLVPAKEEGMQRYVIEVTPLEGEFTTENNVKNVYIDVLDSKQKILLVAAAPHPDIKAIRSIVEKNENYEFNVYIPGLMNQANENTDDVDLKDKFDLVIFHQVPNVRNVGTNLLQEFQQRDVPMWFILGNQSDIMNFNRSNQAVNIISTGRQKDRVTPDYNSSFSKFTFDSDKKAILSKSPPVSVPFGNFELLGSSEVILYQKVGNIVTDKPMLVVSEQDGLKTAVFLGEGIWQWKLQEFATHNKNEAFDGMIGKLIQYLSTKEDKRKFRVYPTSDEYLDYETVFFETEVYNNIYEKIYGQKIDLQITSDDGERQSFSYVNNNANFRFAVNNLGQGIFKYKATTMVEGKQETSEGEFTVRKMEVEAMNTTANFGLLRNLAQQTDGQFYLTSNLETLEANLIEDKAPDIIHSQEEFQEILNFKWILFILIFMATAEWVVRKVKGGY